MGGLGYLYKLVDSESWPRYLEAIESTGVSVNALARMDRSLLMAAKV
jgi:hypothetical protein